MILQWGADFVLGMGFRTDRGQITSLAVQFDSEGPFENAPRSVQVETFYVDNSEAYARLLNATSNAGLSLGMETAGMSADLSRKLEVSSNTAHAVVLSRYESLPQRQAGGTLLPFAKAILEEQGPEAFYNTFGDRWVAEGAGREACVNAVVHSATE